VLVCAALRDNIVKVGATARFLTVPQRIPELRLNILAKSLIPSRELVTRLVVRRSLQGRVLFVHGYDYAMAHAEALLEMNEQVEWSAGVHSLALLAWCWRPQNTEITCEGRPAGGAPFVRCISLFGGGAITVDHALRPPGIQAEPTCASDTDGPAR
jgi:hypothetical protein